MGCSHTIIPASEGHLFACPGSRIGSRVRWIRAKVTPRTRAAQPTIERESHTPTRGGTIGHRAPQGAVSRRAAARGGDDDDCHDARGSRRAANCGELCQQKLADARLEVISGAGHWLELARPDELAKLIIEHEGGADQPSLSQPRFRPRGPRRAGGRSSARVRRGPPGGSSARPRGHRAAAPAAASRDRGPGRGSRPRHRRRR